MLHVVVPPVRTPTTFRVSASMRAAPLDPPWVAPWLHCTCAAPTSREIDSGHSVNRWCLPPYHGKVTPRLDCWLSSIMKAYTNSNSKTYECQRRMFASWSTGISEGSSHADASRQLASTRIACATIRATESHPLPDSVWPELGGCPPRTEVR